MSGGGVANDSLEAERPTNLPSVLSDTRGLMGSALATASGGGARYVSAVAGWPSNLPSVLSDTRGGIYATKRAKTKERRKKEKEERIKKKLKKISG